MNQPPIDQLLSRVDSRYTAVVAAAEGAEPIETIESNKPVTIALYELGSGAIRYERIRKN